MTFEPSLSLLKGSSNIGISILGLIGGFSFKKLCYSIQGQESRSDHTKTVDMTVNIRIFNTVSVYIMDSCIYCLSQDSEMNTANITLLVDTTSTKVGIFVSS